MALLEVAGVNKRFGAVAAVDDVSLTIERGALFALLGPSGCGKTTLLRMIAGLETPDSGRIVIDGVDVTALPPYARPVNMMFQSYALFPHMDVAANIAFGLRQERMDRRRRATRVDEMLALVQMSDYARRRPYQLSGRSAPARRIGAGAGQDAQAAAARRASGRARPQTARRDAARADRHPGTSRNHVSGRDPRPGGGARHGLADRGDERGASRPDRHPGRDLRAAEFPVCRRLRRRGESVRGRADRRAPHCPSLVSRGSTSRSRCPPAPVARSGPASRWPCARKSWFCRASARPVSRSGRRLPRSTTRGRFRSSISLG